MGKAAKRNATKGRKAVDSSEGKLDELQKVAPVIPGSQSSGKACPSGRLPANHKRSASSSSSASSDDDDSSGSAEVSGRPVGMSKFAVLSSSNDDSSSEESSISKSSDEESKEEGSLSESDSEASKYSTPAEPLPPPSKPALKAQARKSQTTKPKSNSGDDFDTLLATLSTTAPKGATTAGAQNTVTAKSTMSKPSAEGDDFDALLAQFAPNQTAPKAPALSPPTSAQEQKTTPQESPSGCSKTADGDQPTGEEAKMSKSRQKKQKKKAAAEAGAEKLAAQQQQQQPPPPQPTKGKPMSAAARLAQQRLQLVKEEQERRAAEERKRQELELKKKQEEEERLRKEQEEKERLRKAKQERRQRLKKEGKLLSAAAKEKLRKAEISRQQFLQSMNIELKSDEPAAATTSSSKRSKAVKTKTRPKKPKAIEEATESFEAVPTEDSMKQATDALVEPEHDDAKAFDESQLQTENAAPEGDTASVASSWDKGTDDESVGSEEEPDEAHGGTKASKSAFLKETYRPDMKSISGKEEPTAAQAPAPPSGEKPSPALAPGSTPLSRGALASAELRSPICCILGHVDTGKTKLLDKIRRTNVQSEEAGGITQQIGATFFPYDALWEQCKKVDPQLNMRVPGLLIIDTPGHESFNNLRARGSSLCDIAILVVDIMHGLEPQTRESLELLRARKCPFVVALNKIDRLYGWAAVDWSAARSALQRQRESTQDEFEKRCDGVLLQLTEAGLNCSLWWKVEDVKTVVSVAPTSAITGEGIPDLLYLLVKLTQSVITRALVFRSEFQCTILEVKAIEGLGTTIDVVLVSGTLYENDKIVVCGMSGPIVTTIRALLTPQPLRELRVKGDYIHHKEIRAAMGVKIAAQGLEEAVAGTSLFVARGKTEEELERLQEDVMSDMASIFKCVDRSGIGVYVMASTLGSLEALLQFLNTSNIPVFAVNLGTVNKIDVKKASVMREKGRPDLCCILAFDIKVDPEAMKEAQSLGVKIFTADIIYHLFDNFNKHVAECQEATKREKRSEVVFPCILSIFPNCVFNKKDPIVLGVKVEDGFVRVGTPICVPERDKLVIGKIASLEHNKKAVEHAKKGDEIAIKIVGDPSIAVGRHFDPTHKLYSKLSRDSIDCLKAYFRDDLTKDDWKAVKEIKKVLGIL